MLIVEPSLQPICKILMLWPNPQEEGGHIQPNERVSPDTERAGTLLLDSQFPNCEKINVSYLSYSLYGICYDNLIKQIYFIKKEGREKGREEGREGRREGGYISSWQQNLVSSTESWFVGMKNARVMGSQRLAQIPKKVSEARNTWQGCIPCRKALRGQYI